MTMGYPAKAVANYFLSKYGKHGITPLKIQKLVYIAHGWHMALHGVENPLVDDEYAEAWEYGPVFSSLYHEFKYRGRLPILELATEIDDDLEFTPPKIPKSDKSTTGLLDRIWEIYGGRTGIELSEMCHQEGSPWDKARKNSQGRRNAHISDEEIAAHYREKLERNKARRNG